MPMPMFTGRHYLQAAMYHHGGRFASMGRFLDYLDPSFAKVPFDAEAVAEAAAIWQRDSVECADVQLLALRTLVARDLAAGIALLANPDVRRRIDAERNAAQSLARWLESGLAELRRWKIDCREPKIHLVDEYPAPYSHLTGFALTLDGGDAIQFGLAPGVYFRTDRVRPVYSGYLLLHELVHTLLGDRSPLILATTFEEGVAELVGGLLLPSRVLGVSLARNLFLYNRLHSGYDVLWDRYLDAARRAALIAFQFGWAGVAELLRSGRDGLAEADAALQAGTYRRLRLPRSRLPAGDRALLEEVLLVRNKSEILSPLAVLLAEYVSAGVTSAEIAHQLGLAPESIRSGLAELEAHQVLIMGADKSVVAMAAPPSVSRQLRYHLEPASR